MINDDQNLTIYRFIMIYLIFHIVKKFGKANFINLAFLDGMKLTDIENCHFGHGLLLGLPHDSLIHV